MPRGQQSPAIAGLVARGYLPASGRPARDADLKTWTVWHLAHQADDCASMGSPLYAALLHAAAEDVAAGGATWDVLQAHTTRDPDAAVALRLMAAVHRLVLTGRAPRLALHYPSVRGDAGAGGAWDAFREVLVEHRDMLRHLAGRPCQTNEVGRCAALALGFLQVAHDSRLPLRLLEVGASAGLNLRWDRYRYADERSPRSAWGDRFSPVQLVGRWDAPQDLLHVPVAVASRNGCDLEPIDATSDEGRLALTASVWADQTARFERLHGALRLAAAEPVEVAAASVAAWLPERLAGRVPGVATVVYHSVVWQYLQERDRDVLTSAMAQAGQVAAADAPLAWLRMEPERPLRGMAVRLTVWPGGEERLLAVAGPHGFPVTRCLSQKSAQSGKR